MTDIIGGRYEIREQLGAGGAGTVYRVVDRALGREVALKLLTGEAGDLAVEFTLLARLNHPHVLRVYDYGHSEGRPYFTMDLLEEATPLSVDDSWGQFFQFLRGLDYIHAQGIVHRDIKPANVLVSGGQVQLADFGLASPQARGGTMFYAAPEQFAGETPDHRSDLYAVGLMLYERAYGAHKHPFLGRFYDALQEAARPPGGMETGPLWDIIRACLERDPAARPDTAGELLLQLSDTLGLGEPLETAETAMAWVQPGTFVGREAELAQLDGWFEAGEAVMAVTGASGVGKSRLAREWGRRLLTAGKIETVVSANSFEEILIAALQQLPGQQRESLRRELLLRSRVEDIELTIFQVLRALPGPVLLLLDEYHQIDEAARQHLTRLTTLCAEEKLAVCFVWVGQALTASEQVLRLSELDRAVSQAVLAGILPGLTLEAAQIVAGHCGGNPAFMEETARALVGRGSVIKTRRGWHLPAGKALPAGAVLPDSDSLTELALSRLAGTARPVRGLLDIAAVLGDRFPVALFEQLTGSSLSVLERHNYIRADEGEARFVSGLLARTLYGQIDPGQRKLLHHRAAEWYLQQCEDDVVALARHFLRSEDERAAEYATRASHQARKALKFHEALKWYGLAASLGADNDQQWEIVLGKDDVWRQLADAAGQNRALAEMVRLANTPARKAVYYNRLARLKWETGHLNQSLAAAKKALAAARSAKDSGEEAKALTGQAQVYYNIGRLIDAQLALDKGLALEISEETRAHMLNMQGSVAAMLGKTQQADEYYRRALVLRRQLGDRWGEALTLVNIGRVAGDKGDFSVALARLEEALALWAVIGDPVSAAIAHVNLGDTARRIGNFGLARKHLNLAADTFGTHGRDDGVFHARHNLAGVMLDCGELERAEETLKDLLAASEGRDMALLLTDLAYLYLQRGDSAQAEAAAQEAAGLWRADDNRPNYHIAAALLAAAGGRADLEAWRDLINNGLNGSENPPYMAWYWWYRALRGGSEDSAQLSLRRGVADLFEQAGRLTNMEHRRTFMSAPPLSGDLLQAWQTTVLGSEGNGRAAAWSGLELWQLRLNDLARLHLDYVLDEIEAGRFEPDEAELARIERAYVEIYELE